MLAAKLAIGLGALYALLSGVVIIATTLQIPRAGSGVDGPVLTRMIAFVVLGFGILSIGTGAATLRWPLPGRWLIVLVGIAPVVTMLVMAPEALKWLPNWLLLLPSLIVAIFAASR